MTIADELERLHNLRESGAISEQEYQKAKQAILDGRPAPSERLKNAVDDISSDVNMWTMLMHLAQFCGYIVPLAGLIVPIVLWQIKKDESCVIDMHGKVIANWIITEFILGIICGLLVLILIGIPLLFGLAIASIVFPIIGAVKASNGELWPYPLSIQVFKLNDRPPV